MKKNNFEVIVGSVVLLVAFLFFLTILKISKSTTSLDNTYNVVAEFNNIDGITIGSDVKISGVKVGTIEKITLNKENYNAVVVMNVEKDLKIPIDSIFKITSSGLIGGKFVNVKIGADEIFLENNSVAEFTESTMDLEDLISRFVFNKKDEN
jgi:phospholipid/cholesterol/gamma-HCH transport system substrate-binding protein